MASPQPQPKLQMTPTGAKQVDEQSSKAVFERPRNNERRDPDYVIQKLVEDDGGSAQVEKRMAAVGGADGDLQGELSTVIQSLRRMSRRPTDSAR